MTVAQQAAVSCPTPYRRRRPERTLLYRTVQTHFATWLALAREGTVDGDAVPAMSSASSAVIWRAASSPMGSPVLVAGRAGTTSSSRSRATHLRVNIILRVTRLLLAPNG